MAVNLSIKDVPDDVAARLRERALRNHRSLQGELMAIVEQAAASPVAASSALTGRGQAVSPVNSAAGMDRTSGWKSVEQLLAERRASAWVPHPSLNTAPLAVDIVRADRDSR